MFFSRDPSFPYDFRLPPVLLPIANTSSFVLHDNYRADADIARMSDIMSWVVAWNIKVGLAFYDNMGRYAKEGWAYLVHSLNTLTINIRQSDRLSAILTIYIPSFIVLLLIANAISPHLAPAQAKVNDKAPTPATILDKKVLPPRTRTPPHMILLRYIHPATSLWPQTYLRAFQRVEKEGGKLRLEKRVVLRDLKAGRVFLRDEVSCLFEVLDNTDGSVAL
jgi:hypothetical protein